MVHASVDDYLASLPPQGREALGTIRAVLHDAVPGADEGISYGMPVLLVRGQPLVHFAAWKRHTSLYPVPDGDAEAQRLLAPYLAERSTLRFPLREPVPVDVVRRVAELHLARLGHSGP